MSAPALVCLAPDSEEIEAVATTGLLVRDDIKVTAASVASDSNLAIIYSRDVKLLANVPLIEVANGEYDVIVLPGGIKGAGCFRDSILLIEIAKRFHHSGRIIMTICAVPATVLAPHGILLISNMTGLPTLRDKIPTKQWQDKRVVWDVWIKLLVGQGLGTVIDFGLKIIDLLVGREKAREVASQLVVAAGICNYYEQRQIW